MTQLFRYIFRLLQNFLESENLNAKFKVTMFFFYRNRIRSLHLLLAFFMYCLNLNLFFQTLARCQILKRRLNNRNYVAKRSSPEDKYIFLLIMVYNTVSLQF